MERPFPLALIPLSFRAQSRKNSRAGSWRSSDVSQLAGRHNAVEVRKVDFPHELDVNTDPRVACRCTYNLIPSVGNIEVKIAGNIGFSVFGKANILEYMTLVINKIRQLQQENPKRQAAQPIDAKNEAR